MVTDSTPSSVAAGGGAFIAHVGRLNGILGRGLTLLLLAGRGLRAAGLEMSWNMETKNPAGFLGEQGSRKIDDL